jgi:DNA-binding NarL/FixJ family response regulator
MSNSLIKIAIADDHIMIRKAIAAMIESFGGYEVTIQADNGAALLDKLNTTNELPHLALLDIQMPQMDGIKTALALEQKFPAIRKIALTMLDNENAIICMIKNGARAYLVKDSEPEELKQALHDVYHKGFYYTDIVTGRLVYQLQNQSSTMQKVSLVEKITEREIQFLKLCCTELTYKEIAYKLTVSPRTIDGYRDNLFEKLGVKSRVGLAMFTVRMGL